MKKPISDLKKKKKKVLTKKLSKKKKTFKDPFLRDLTQKKVKKTDSSSSTTPAMIPINSIKEEDSIISRTAANKANINRLLPKTRLQLPTHALRSARTFAQCPSMSVVSHEPATTQHRQLPVVCSRGALNFHARRLGTGKRVDNQYRLGQIEKRTAGKRPIDQL